MNTRNEPVRLRQMFGYIVVNKEELKVKEYDRYRSFYCGLCDSLHRRSGRAGQMTLTYDMTFLVILLEGLYEERLKSREGTCLVHPFEKRTFRRCSWSDYAADMNVLLAYYDLLDDWKDDRSLSRRAAAGMLRQSRDRIAGEYPRQAEAVADYMRGLAACEARGGGNPEEAASLTGKMLGEIFVPQQDCWSDDLRTIGFFLGKFIYLMDAYEDIDSDSRNGNYNPLKKIAGEPDFDRRCRQILMMQMAPCCMAFERLPIVRDVQILRNILYSGVWIRFAGVYRKRTGDEQ